MEKTAILLGCRNDGYKEDERIITCLTSMVETFDEVWFCDWNTPSGKLPLLWELKDKIEDKILDVIAEFKNISDWCIYRTVRKYHIVDTKLEPGYHESDTLVMHSVFSILVDFVEMQKAWMYVICDDDVYYRLSWI